MPKAEFTIERKRTPHLSHFEARSWGTEVVEMTEEVTDRVASIDTVCAQAFVSNALGRLLQRLGLIQLEVTIYMKGRKHLHGIIQTSKGCNKAAVKEHRTVRVKDRRSKGQSTGLQGLA